MQNNFEEILILGTGTLALNCAQWMTEQNLPYRLFDSGEERSDLMERTAKGKGFSIEPYHCWNEIKEILKNIEKKTLIISAINPRILPKSVLEKPQVSAINCHQALLPNHPGRNAECWAIFDEDEMSGITWHTMTAQVDAGAVLIQKELPLDAKMTSFKLFRSQIKLAMEGFLEIIESVLAETIQGIPQDFSKKGTLHYSYELPNKGALDFSWSGKKISAFLRAMDYSVLNVLGKPRMEFEGTEWTIEKYKIKEVEWNKEQQNSACTVRRDQEKFLLEKDGYQIQLTAVQIKN